jgi:gas vesicle protein
MVLERWDVPFKTFLIGLLLGALTIGSVALSSAPVEGSVMKKIVKETDD